MKKMIMAIVSVIATAFAIGFAPVSAEAKEDTAVTMADVVRELKSGYASSVTYSDSETAITFRWSIMAEEEFDLMIHEIMGTEDQIYYQCELAARGLTHSDYRRYMTNWHIATEVSYHPFTTIVMV